MDNFSLSPSFYMETEEKYKQIESVFTLPNLFQEDKEGGSAYVTFSDSASIILCGPTNIVKQSESVL